MTVEELKKAVADGTVDTVLLAIADMEGRLQGKRLTATHFLDDTLEHGAEGCNYLLAVDVDMETVGGYAMASWDDRLRRLRDEAGPGDAAARCPWHPGTVMLMADLEWEDGREVVASPRQILRRQLARLTERGFTRERRHRARVHGLPRHLRGGLEEGLPRPRAGQPLQHRLLAARQRPGRAADPPDPQRDGRRPGSTVENSKGECNLGQHEINFRYEEALRSADNHAIYKNGAKEIAAQEGQSITFMAKFNEREGNSCHIHCSLAGEDGKNAFAADQALFDHFVAGQIACMKDLTLLYAPHVNSYKRFAPGSFAPTAIAWGRDNRTCSLRVVGHGEALRVENRLPGADVNPYLALSAMIAAGLHGIENELRARAGLRGQRLRVRQAARPAQHLRRPRRLRGERGGRRGVRRRRRRPLPEPGAGRDRRLRGGGHRLGALPGLRATLMERCPARRDLRRRSSAPAGESGTARR